jgi:hypothetical protein
MIGRSHRGGLRSQIMSRRVDVRVAVLACVVAVALTAVQLSHGVVPVWDTVSYWSGAEALTNGKVLAAHVQPSFSNFTTIDVLRRQGELPFVDFPYGYPVLLAAVGAPTGVKTAMVLLSATSTAVLVGAVVLGAEGRSRSVSVLGVRAVVVLAMILSSPYRVTTRAGMSEPLFCALVIVGLAALLRYRRTGEGWATAFFCLALASVVRYVGAALIVLPVVERRRRDGHWRGALGYGAAGLVLPVANMAWAAGVGGGHTTRLHGVSQTDVERFARSVAGWVDARHANVGLTFFTDEGAAWWAWILAGVWLVACLWALIGFAGLGVRARFPAPLELCLCTGALLTGGLVGGMVGFDALVNPDNRVMLPAGVFTIVGVVWSIPSLQRSTAAVALAAAGVFGAFSSIPRGAPDPLTVRASEPAEAVVARASGAALVVTTAADIVHWYTGIPAAYPPRDRLELTDERVDVSALWSQLPCALAEADGVLILDGGGGFFGYDASELARLVDAGDFQPVASGKLTMYWPSPDSCP